MKIIINSKTFTIDTLLSSNSESKIYLLDSLSVAKIYHKQALNREIKLKVLALCNAYQNYVTYIGNGILAFPQHPIYENKEVLDSLCGYSMEYFKDYSKLSDITFNLQSSEYKSNKFCDQKAVEFIYNIFDVIDRLHKSRIILGNISPSNILYNEQLNYPIIIDLDSAQIGEFRCHSWSDEYLDPLVQLQGRNLQGEYNYTYESDVFSIACICFEFIIGVNPFLCKTAPSNNILTNKENGISILRFIYENNKTINHMEYLNNPVNNNIKNRINILKSEFPKLFDFFISILLDSKRISLMQSLRRDDQRHPAYCFYNQSDDDTLKQTITVNKTPITSKVSKISKMPMGSFTTSFPESINSISKADSNTNSTDIPHSTFTESEQINFFLKNYGIDLSNL